MRQELEGSVAHTEHREAERCFVVRCSLGGETYYANYSPDLSWRSRHLMRNLTVAAHERICVVYRAMCAVESVEQ